MAFMSAPDGVGVRHYSRPGSDLTHRFPLIVEALARLRARSCVDGAAVCCDDDGRPSFDRIRYRRPLPLGRPPLGREGFEPRL
jgi:ATP-dependent DNA ligase